MEIKKCMSCMQNVSEDVCPHCGFSLSKYSKPEHALNCGVILNARYLLGAAMEIEAGLCYAGFDLETEAIVQIIEPASTNETEQQPGCVNMLDCFWENGRYYCVSEKSGKTAKTQPGNPKKKQKALWIGIAIAAMVLVSGTVVALQAAKSNRYQAAQEAYQAGNYADAVTQFQELANYKDAKAMVEQATQYLHYETGVQAKREKRYVDAIAEFELAPDVPEANKQAGESYQLLGSEYLTKQSYLKARDAFSKAKEYGAKDAGVYVTYAEGLNDLSKKDYSAAIEKLTRNISTTKDLDAPIRAYSSYITQMIGDNEFEEAKKLSVDYGLFCEKNKCDTSDADYLHDGAILSKAEALYDEGSLAKAQAAFEEAREGAQYNGIDRDTRLKKLEKHRKLMDMEGTWCTVSGRSSLVSGSWIYYYDLKEANLLPLSIQFVLNDDDTVTARGSCTWLSCAGLLTTQQKVLNFEAQTNPRNIQLAGVEGVKGKIAFTQSRDKLNIRFTSTDGTTVKYVYKNYFKEDLL